MQEGQLGGTRLQHMAEVGGQGKSGGETIVGKNIRGQGETVEESRESIRGTEPEERRTPREEVESHRKYFREGDWQRLLYILQ
jgi:hypothetical protein